MSADSRGRIEADCVTEVDRTMLPPLASLRAFEAVGRVGGVRRAAQELGVDHAVISRHLRGLETLLGLALFDRSGAMPKLNAVGRQYHQAISAGLEEIGRATRQTRAGRDQDRLLISCEPGFAARWLSPNLDDFRGRHPEIEVELRPTDTPPCFDKDEVDSDIRFVRDVDQASPALGIAWLTIARPQVFPVASPLWLAEHPFSGDPAAMLEAALIHEASDVEWRGWFLAHGIDPGPRLSGPRLWHAHLTLDAARRGQGVALANAFLIAGDVGAGQLESLARTDGSNAGPEIGDYVFACRSDSAESPAIKQFRTWVAARASQPLQGIRTAAADALQWVSQPSAL